MLCVGLLVCCLAGTVWAEDKAAAGNPTVVMKTSKGTIEIELFQDTAPISVENFMSYVDKGFYDGTIFHRVIQGFMIQGGGFGDKMSKKQTAAAIKNEAENGLRNVTGTIAMARTSVIDSATSQFFINTADNTSLDHSGPGSRFGYAVFGKVTSGMDVVKKIESSPTGTQSGMRDVPSEQVVIESVKRK